MNISLRLAHQIGFRKKYKEIKIVKKIKYSRTVGVWNWGEKETRNRF